MEKNTIIESIKAGMLILIAAFQIGIVSELAMLNSAFKKNSSFDHQPSAIEERDELLPPKMNHKKHNENRDMRCNCRGIDEKRNGKDFMRKPEMRIPEFEEMNDKPRFRQQHHKRFEMNDQKPERKHFMIKPDAKPFAGKKMQHPKPEQKPTKQKD